MRLILLSAIIMSLAGCSYEKPKKPDIPSASKRSDIQPKMTWDTVSTRHKVLADSIILSKKHHQNIIKGDWDGDGITDSARLVQNTFNKKYGLEIAFANKQKVYFGMGKEVLQQGFYDISWAEVFKKVPKGTIVWNNVNDDGEIITENKVSEKDKTKLEHDAVFIHQKEACGGGIIYYSRGQFHWIQQE